MQVLALLLSLWLAIQNYSDGCTIICNPCKYACAYSYPIGADCSGFKECNEECPPGTFAIRQLCKYLFIFVVRSKDITLLHI